MSRVGKKPLTIPKGVDVTVEGDVIAVKGPKGRLTTPLLRHVRVSVEGDILSVDVADPEHVKQRAVWGLTRRLIENMVNGVTKGFERKLEVNGIGYKVALQGKVLKLDVGYSHDVDFPLPEDVTAAVDKNVITLFSIDKQRVGEIAAQIRRIRKPEPYKGKGIKYMEEVIVRKAGKAAKASA